MMVMPASGAGVDAQEHTATAEHLAPFVQYEQVIERHDDVLLQCPGVLRAWRKIGREQDALPIQARDALQQMLDLTA